MKTPVSCVVAITPNGKCILLLLSFCLFPFFLKKKNLSFFLLFSFLSFVVFHYFFFAFSVFSLFLSFVFSPTSLWSPHLLLAQSFSLSSILFSLISLLLLLCVFLLPSFLPFCLGRHVQHTPRDVDHLTWLPHVASSVANVFPSQPLWAGTRFPAAKQHIHARTDRRAGHTDMRFQGRKNNH